MLRCELLCSIPSVDRQLADNLTRGQPQPAESYVQYLVQLHNKLEFAATKARLRLLSPMGGVELTSAHAGCEHHGAARR